MEDGTGGAPRRAVAAWVLYDFAYGAFTTVVSTFVFATYFTQGVARDPATGAAQWASAQALAGILIALLSVPLGAVADRAGRRRLMLGVFTAIMIAATFALWTIRPHGDVFAALTLVVVATVAFEVATVFYNAMLPDWSRRAVSAGYPVSAGAPVTRAASSVLALSLTLLVSPDPPLFGLSKADAEPVRATRAARRDVADLVLVARDRVRPGARAVDPVERGDPPWRRGASRCAARGDA